MTPATPPPPLQHVSNPLCWALIPETTEGEVTYSGTYRTFRDAVILVLKSFVCCEDCEACWMLHEQRNSPRVKQFMRSDEYKAGKLHVDAALCDHHLGFPQIHPRGIRIRSQHLRESRTRYRGGQLYSPQIL
jgi:hypothetical protein